MDLLKDTIQRQYGQKIRVRVCGLLVTGQGLLLAGLQGLIPEGNFWIPPGGGLEFGETLHQALQREFSEETGLAVNVHELLRLHQFIKPPLHALEFFFRVTHTGGSLVTGSDPELNSAVQLIKEVRFFQLEELKQMPADCLHPVLHNLHSFPDLLQPNLRFPE